MMLVFLVVFKQISETPFSILQLRRVSVPMTLVVQITKHVCKTNAEILVWKMFHVERVLNVKPEVIVQSADAQVDGVAILLLSVSNVGVIL